VAAWFDSLISDSNSDIAKYCGALDKPGKIRRWLASGRGNTESVANKKLLEAGGTASGRRLCH
jgi:hypothetical protein